MSKIGSIIDDQTENSKLSNRTKNKNILNHVILSLVLQEIYTCIRLYGLTIHH